MKPHELIAPWKGHAEYPAIAKLAAELVKSGLSSENVVGHITSLYGKPNRKATLRPQRQPLKIYGQVGVDIEGAAVEQITTALQLPIAIRGALMPDAHPAYALPVGGVVAYHRAIAPYQVGVDIGCRMHLSVFESGLTPTEALQDRERLLQALESVTVFGVGAQQRKVQHRILSDKRWQETALLRDLHEKAKVQIGTSGAGNHFAEIVIGDWLDGSGSFMGMLTHSGSRGVGYAIAMHYTKVAEKEMAKIAFTPKRYEWLSLDSEAGEEYYHAMQLAGDFAQANHEVIHTRFANALGTKPTQTIQNHHNFAWIEGSEVIHRKGATPAEVGVMGIIPGSMGTNSYIVRGLGNEDALHSASHGAGRIGSRTQAKATIDVEVVKRFLAEKDVLVRGVSLDESPQAYKDIERVMQIQVEAGLIEPMARMRPIAVIMAGTKGED